MEKTKIIIQNSCYSKAIYKHVEGFFMEVLGTNINLQFIANCEDGFKILSGDEDVIFVHPLVEFPISYPDEIVIAALSQRIGHQICLLLHKDIKTGPGILDFNAGIELHSYREDFLTYFSNIKPDIITTKLESISQLLDQINTGKCKAALLDQFYIDFGLINKEMYQVSPLNVKEFVPAAGSGCLAFICRKDKLHIRKVLKNIHSEGIEKETNSERNLIRSLKKEKYQEYNIHISKDKNHYFHISFCHRSKEKKEYEIENFSLSTTVGLTEYIINKIR
jgi:porphobilinogen deaminase